jgi:hypothetical protein
MLVPEMLLQVPVFFWLFNKAIWEALVIMPIRLAANPLANFVTDCGVL